MLRRRFIAVLFALPFASAARAGEPEIFTGLLDGYGAAGYDVVAYFSGKPAEGKDEFTADWKGAKWRFASAANMKAFQAAPEKFAPQYGGYCAYGVAKGSLVKGEPLQWTVSNDKLYLNYNASIHEKWKADVAGFVTKANNNWPELIK